MKKKSYTEFSIYIQRNRLIQTYFYLKHINERRNTIMTTIIILAGLIVLCAIFYRLSVLYSSKVFLTLHYIVFMIFACVLYPIFVKKSGLYIFSTFLFFLPIISTLRLFEMNKQKAKERKMRAIN